MNVPKEWILIPEQARCDNRVQRYRVLGGGVQNHEPNWLKPRCKGRRSCFPSSDPEFMPDQWTIMEAAWARPWAKCWDHHKCMRHCANPGKAHSPGIEGSSRGLVEPTDRAPGSAFRIRTDFQEGTMSRLGPEGLKTMWQVQR